MQTDLRESVLRLMEQRGLTISEHARKVLEAAVELARARAACKADNIDPVSFRTDFSRFQAAMRCEHEMFVAADALLREMEKGPKP